MIPTITVNGAPLATSGLRLAVESQGSGGLSFDYDPASWRPSTADVVAVALDGTTTPTRFVPADATASKVGRGLRTVDCVSLLESWASSTVWYPEYDEAVIGGLSGTDRGIGWMMTAYDHTSDPREPWDRAYTVSRAKPPNWPAGSAAQWVSASRDAGDPSPDYTDSERKLFRGNLTVGGSNPILVKVYLSSDEGATLWVGGEMLLQTYYTEEGKKNTEEVAVVLWPGTYAVGVDTQTHVTKGGDGHDPVMVSIWSTTATGDPSSELWASNTSTLRACRRNDEGAGSEPPGPTPGQVLRAMIEEAQGRNVCGWTGVTLGFTDTHDSYGVAWQQSTERIVRVGMDDYWQFLRLLAETDCDVWMDGMVLHAAPQQGRGVTTALNTTTIATASDADDLGGLTVVLARSYAGWSQRQVAGFRREKGLEVGTALSGHTAAAVADQLLSEQGRWDGSIRWVPPAGTMPLVDVQPGDQATITYPTISGTARILSVSGEAGEGGMLWQLECSDG